MRIPDALLGQWYRLVMDEDDVPGRRSSRGEARARALHRHALARRGGRSGGRSALHARRARGTCARRGPRGRVARRRSRTPAVAARRRARDRHHERGPPALEQGAVRVNDEVVTELDLPRERLVGRAPPGGKAPVRAVSCGVAVPLLPCPRRLARGCMKPANDTGDPSSQKIRPTYHLARGAFGANRRLFYGPQQRVWSLKTQQRETSRLFGWSLRGAAGRALLNPSCPLRFRRGMTLSSSST